MSSSDSVAVRFVKEVTLGVTPATPALKVLRITSEGLKYDIDNTTSKEMRPDRTQADLVPTGAKASGNLNFEMSYGSFKEFLAALFCADWTVDTGDKETLTNGTALTTFSVQKHFQDMAPQQYHTFRGCGIESMNLKMDIGKIVEGSFSVMALGMVTASAQIAGATIVPAPTTQPMNAVANLQNFTIGGVPYSGCISSLNLTIKNNLRANACIGSLDAKTLKLGTLEVSGDMEFYFNEGTNLAAYIAGTSFDISFDLIDGAGNKYSFDISRAKFETGEVLAGGKNTDTMFSAKWRGLYDGVSGRVIRITSDPV